ncbi:hypothetical protein [Xenorhabdus bovienii]|uniref:Pyridoxamine 5'-phosphate oxidase putative domain-containing protein n=1 Tax=Xenorhabdus bovienii str. Intermedium TaxID=1379677 RepID=A0A077QQR2_XENBV|nr:hypothetical protein [Xenorhabdus bovienii]CDH34886.1 conserved hypothetical protein [Xenorhabdus bovienii str. Intermedium]
MNKHAKISFYLLRNMRFFSLATKPHDLDSPWSASLLYIPKYDPLRLIWFSKLDARHSQAISINPHVSGSMFLRQVNPISPPDINGAQFIGRARAIPYDELQETYDDYYKQVFPNEDTRKQKALPIRQFYGRGPRRFYELKVREWWLFDSEKQDDSRILVPLSELTHPPEDQ